MFRRSIIAVVILVTIIGGSVLPFTICNAQTEFPRISFLDPYWVHLKKGAPQFSDSLYYWPQMEQCKLTHTVTIGDNTSLREPDTLRVLNCSLGGNVWRYANGVANEYPVGGGNSFFDPPDTAIGADGEDAGRDVFLMLRDTHLPGVVLDGSFYAQDQYYGGDYWFLFTMKMVGDTSVSDTVAKLHIWETPSKFDLYGCEHRGLLNSDSSGSAGKDPADVEIYVYYSDFSDTGSYEDVKIGPVPLAAWQNKTHMTFEWLGYHDLYVDHLWVRDDYNYELIVAENDSVFTYIQDKLEDKNNINPARNYRFFQDEPKANMYESFGKVNALAKERPEVPLNGATGTFTEFDLRHFVGKIDPDELIYNEYTIRAHIDSATDVTPYSNSIQYAWDNLIYLPKDSWTYAGLRAVATVASDSGVPFWMTIQACNETRLNDTTGVWECWYRAPTRNELFAEAHLALCYGAKGIMYFLYPTVHDSTYDPETMRYSGTKYYGLVDLVKSNGDTTWHYDEGYYVPNYRWYAAQEINAKIDSLDEVLLSLNWIDAFVCDSIASYNTFVEDLYSHDFENAPYVEIGVFEHDDGTEYLMLVNRRCLSTEDQRVDVWIDTTLDVYMLQDIYNGEAYLDGNGRFEEIHLDPGEGRIFKLSTSPPAAITDLTVTLVDTCLFLQWSAVTADTTGNPHPIDYYVVYRDTMPGFSPTSSESIAAVETTGYVDCAIVGDCSINYYYVARAVDYGYNKSCDSNQVGEFDKSLSEKGGDEFPWPPSK